MVSGRVCLRAGRCRPRRCRRAGQRFLSADGRQRIRRRLLGSGHIHPADGHGGADRIRRRHQPAGGPVDRSPRHHAPDGKERGEFRCVPFYVGLLPELGTQPGLRWSAGPGDRPPDRSAGRLSRARRRGLHGTGRCVGAGHVIFGRTAAGNCGLAASRAPEDHRGSRLRHHDLHLAVPADVRHHHRADRGDRSFLRTQRRGHHHRRGPARGLGRPDRRGAATLAAR